MMWLLVGLMIAIAGLLILLPLRKTDSVALIIDSNTANVAILKEQLSELEAEFASGGINEALYDQARLDLEASAAAELINAESQHQMGLSGKNRVALGGLLLVLLAVGSLLTYENITTFQANPPAGSSVAAESDSTVASGKSKAPPMAEMAEVLAARLRQNPEDARGWFMLGKSYMVLNRIADAVGAYDAAYRLVGDQDADLLADYAEALAYANGDSMLGRPAELVDKALRLQPKHAKALWLAGFAAMQSKAYVAAINHWRGLLENPRVPAQTQALAKQYISQAQELAGLSDNQPAATGSKEVASDKGEAGLSVTVSVSLDKSLADKVKPDEVVYIFARASKGMPMPVAVKRLTVADLPITVVLDDSMAMMKGNSLSSHTEVIVGARVSRAGTPMPNAGDLQGLGSPINPREVNNQTIIINQVVK